MKYKNLYQFAPVLFLACSLVSAFAQDTATERILFSNPNIKTSYSPLMLEKNSHSDFLLPSLNGDRALADLFSANPNLWSIENTKLNVNIIYIDGTREEAFCNFSETADAKNWELNIGLDFVSGSSNLAGVHIQQCINQVKDSIGCAILGSAGKTIRKGNIFRIIIFSLSAASVGLGFWQDRKIASKGKKTGGLYIDAWEEGERGGANYLEKYFAYNENVNDIRRSENLRNGFYISAGAFGFAGIVSFFF